MYGYIDITEEIGCSISKFIKKGEACKLSGEFEYNGKVYREVVFSKRNLKSFRNEPQGYLYLSSDNSIVTLVNVQRGLVRLAHYYELFFSGEKGTGIVAALQTEGDMEREKGHKEDIIKGLDFLCEEGISDAERVKNVVNSLPGLREKSNIKINELTAKVAEIKSGNLSFNEELLQILYPLYEDILRLNFEKVKLIGTLSDCCDYVKNQAEKTRKKWKIRFKTKFVGPLLRVSDEISYLRRIIATYEKVINFNTSQYMKFLNNLNKEKIENRANMIRI